MKSNATIELYYDPDNQQIDYEYIAKEKNTDDNEVIGYLVIEKPWYASKEDWNYYIYYNKYYNEMNRIEQVLIEPSTLRPYTQIEQIKYHLKTMNVSLKKNFYLDEKDEPKDNLIAFIECGMKIPINLWKEGLK